MDTNGAVARRILMLCKEQRLTPNALCYISAVPQSTVNSILNLETRNPGVVTIKKLCDGLGITLADFFDSHLFRTLGPEVR